jgi:hypothetical protein
VCVMVCLRILWWRGLCFLEIFGGGYYGDRDDCGNLAISYVHVQQSVGGGHCKDT